MKPHKIIQAIILAIFSIILIGIILNNSKITGFTIIETNQTFVQSATIALNASNVTSIKATGNTIEGISTIYFETTNGTLLKILEANGNTTFTNTCVNTCSLIPSTGNIVVLLRDNATLNLESLSYTTQQILGNVEQIALIPDINLTNSTTINLSSYFVETAQAPLTFSANIPAQVRFALFEDLLFLSARENGLFNATIIASNGAMNVTSSFLINVTGQMLDYQTTTTNQTTNQTPPPPTFGAQADPSFGTSTAPLPDISFVAPTPANNTVTRNTSVIINVSITNSSGGQINEIKFNWNGTNYTLYNDSLVLMMNFDNVSAIGENGTNAIDVSKYGNNGTCPANGCPNWINHGKYGGAFNFVAANTDILTIPGTTSLTGSSEITISAWVNRTSATFYGTVLCMANVWVDPFGDYCLQYEASSDDIYFHIGKAAGSYTNLLATTPGNNVWFHAVGTYNGTNMTIYINGVNANSVITTAMSKTTSAALRLGTASGSDYLLNGAIDEVRIWNRTLTADEVTQLYYSNLNKYTNDSWQFVSNQTNLSTTYGTIYNFTATTKDVSGNENTTETRYFTIGNTAPTISSVILNSTSGGNTTADNLTVFSAASDPDIDNVSVNYDWRLNGTSIAVLNLPMTAPYNNGSRNLTFDFSTNNKFGVMNETAPTWISSGKYGGTYAFNGNNNAIIFDDVFNATQGRNITISVWVKIERATNWILGKPHHNSNLGQYALYTNTDQFTFGISNDAGSSQSIRFGNTTSANNTWTHLAITHQFGNDTSTKTYLNGTLIASTWNGNGNTTYTACAETGCRFEVGHWYGTPPGTSDLYWMNGTIDEVQIYNKTLSPEQIAAIYNSSAPRYDRLVANETGGAGNNWSVLATPIDNLGLNGTGIFSNNLTILDVSIAARGCRPTTNFANNNFSCNATVSTSGLTVKANVTLPNGNLYNMTLLNDNFNYTFSFNGSVVGQYNISWITNNSITTSTIATDSFTVNNSAPTITSVAINSTTGANTTAENLTAYPTGTGDINPEQNVTVNYDWRLNGTSIAVLNLPMTAPYNNGSRNLTFDFSSFNNVGVLGNLTPNTSPTFNASGKYGSSYSFDGVNDYINSIGTTSTFSFIQNKVNFSMSFWLNNRNGGDSGASIPLQGIITNTDTTQENGFYLVYNLLGTKDISIDILRSVSGQHVIKSSTPADAINDTNWHNVVVVGNGTNIIYYIDSVRTVGTSSVGTLSSGDSTRILAIGTVSGSAGIYSFFNGSIDEVRIYNRSLSAEEIFAIYNNSAPRYDILVNNETGGAGNNWSVLATPIDNLGLNGTGLLSNNLTILDVSIAARGCRPLTNFANNNFSCNATTSTTGLTVRANVTLPNGNLHNMTLLNDNFNYTFSFNGSVVGQYNISWITNNSITTSTIATDSFTVNNSAPTITSVLINSTTGGNTTADNLTAYPSNFGDINPEQNVTINYDWRLNGTSIAVLNLPMTAPYNNGTLNQTFDFSSAFTKTVLGGSGSLAGITAPIWNASGIYGAAYTFDGTNDFINTTKTYGQLGIQQGLTLETWIDPANAHAPSVPGPMTVIGDTNNLVLLVANETIVQVGQHSFTTRINASININGFYHVVTTYSDIRASQSNTIKLYVNGTLRNSSTTTNSALDPLIENVHIGHDTGSGTRTQFNGSIDEVRIYNRSLSAEEIFAIYNNSAPRYNILVSNETGGAGNNWSVLATPIDNLGLNGTGILSNNLTILDVTITARGCRPLTNFANNNFSCNATISTTGLTVRANVTLPNGNLHNMTLLNDGFNYTFSFNGSVVGQYNVSWVTNNSITTSTATDSFIVNNSAPTISSVLINSTTGGNTTADNLTAYPSGVGDINPEQNVSVNYDWRLNGSSITMLNLPMTAPYNNGSRNLTFDFSTNKFVGVMSGTTAPFWNTTGKYGGSYSFDGTDDYIDLKNMGNFPKKGTIMFWMNAKEVVNYRNPFTTDFSGLNAGIRFEEDSTGKFATVINYTSVADVHTFITSGMSANRWYFISLVWNSTINNVKGYFNGTLVFDDAQTNWPTVLPDVSVGRGYNNDGDRFWNGGVDEVQIYNRSLSAEEIFVIYNNSAPRYDLLVSNETGSAGNNWSVLATPIDNLGLNGTGILSNNLTILDVTITARGCRPLTNFASNNFSCNATVSTSGLTVKANVTLPNGSLHNMTLLNDNFNYTFSFNGSVVGQYNISWQTNNSITTSTATDSFIVNNSAPTITSVLINSTTGGNTTADNLTAYPSSFGDINPEQNVTINYDWRLNGTSIAVLNLPMTAPYNNGSRNLTWDFSSFNNLVMLGNDTDGTRQPIFNHSGKYGGAYTFDGTNDYLDILSVSNLNSTPTNFTYAIWINADSFSGTPLLFSNHKQGCCGDAMPISGITSWVDPAGTVTVQTRLNNSCCQTLTGNVVLTTNKWFFVAATYNGSLMSLYINGTLDNTIISNNGKLEVNKNTILGVNGDTLKQTGDYANMLKGSLDELTVYNRTLSAEEIFAIYNNSAPRYNILVNNETGGAGNNWSVQATPIDNLGLNGTGVLSNNLTILDVTITARGCRPLTNFANNNFSCNATISTTGLTVSANVTLPNGNLHNMSLLNDGLNYTFSFNGSVVGQYNISWQTNNSITTSTTTDSFIVNNSAPIISSVLINSTTGANTTADNLTAYPSSFGDINPEQNVTINYDWRLNGSSIAVLNLPMTAPYNNGSRNLTFDFSTNKFVGELGVGSASPIWNSSGKYGGAYTFDGVDDNINISNNPALNPSSISVLAWAQTSDTGTFNGVVDKGWQNSGYLLDIHNSVPRFNIQAPNGTFYSAQNDTVTDGRWYFLAGTYDNITHDLKLYINGTLRGINSSGALMGLTDINLVIGGDGASTNFLQGSIDEVRIYNRSLSAEEIFAIYNNSSPRYDVLVSNETGGAGNNWSVLATPIDNLGLNGTGVLSNNLTILDVSITARGCRPLTNFANNNFSCNATISTTGLTVKANVTLPNGNLHNMTLLNDGLNYTFSFNGSVVGQYNVSWQTNNSITTSLPATDSFTVNNSAPTITSALINSTTGANTTADNLTAYPTGIGDLNPEQNISINYDWRLNGTSIELLNLPMTAPYNNGSRNLTFDFSTNNNVGILGSGTDGTTQPTWNSSGIYGGSYSFDGNNDFINSFANSLKFGTRNFTITMWVNPTTFASEAGLYDSLVLNGVGGRSDAFILVQTATTGKLRIFTNGAYSASTSQSLNLNTWNYVSLVNNGGNLSFYINKTRDPITVSFTTNDNSGGGVIGRYADVASGFFKGGIDEVRVYNRTLSTEEIFSIYNNSAPRYDRLVPNETGGIGNNWSVKATPIDNLGLNGTGVLSNNLTISPNKCGVVSSSTTLVTNVLSTGNTCFQFTTTNITFDCAGYNITSNPFGIQAFNISNTNTTIKNCNIQNFSVGINISTGINISLFNNNITNTTDGIWLNNTTTSVLENNSINATSGTGIYLTNSNNNTILRNTAASNAVQGIHLTTSNNNSLQNNTFTSNNLISIFLSTKSDGNNFVNNTLLGSTGFEINNSNNIIITNTSFQNTIYSIKTALGSNASLIDNEIMTNYTFANAPSLTITKTGIASVNFFNIINANGTNLSIDVNLTNNKVHVNTSRSSGLNVSANITLFNLNTFRTPIITVDYLDTGTTESCVSPKCINLSFSSGTLIFNVSSFTTYTTVNGCGLINESSNLSANTISNGGPCFDFNQSNILFDCAGYNITSNPAGLQAFNITTFITGTTKSNLSNITIQNCNIQNFSIGINVSSAGNINLINNNITNSTDGIRFNNTAKSVIENNNINTTPGIPVYLSNSSNNTIDNNNISSFNSLLTDATLSFKSSFKNDIHDNIINCNFLCVAFPGSLSGNHNFTNNLITGRGLGGSTGPTVNVPTNNNNFKNNTIIASGISTIAVTVTALSELFANNTILSKGNAGVGMEVQGITSTIQNVIQSEKGDALRLRQGAINNNFINNTFISNNSIAIIFSTTQNKDNNFTNNTLIGSTGFSISGGTRNRIINTSFQNTNWSINTDSGANVSLIDNQRMTNYTFANAPSITITKTGIASINFFNIINANGTNLSMDVNLTTNTVHVNTSRSSGLNVTANITLFNLANTARNQQVMVDYSDTGTFEACPSIKCNILNQLSNRTITFNVSSFTTYQITNSCGVINESTTLTQNILSSGNSCFDLNQSNILFDCAGYNVSSNPSGNIGINISNFGGTNLSNITIQNCNIDNFTTGIKLNYSSNVSIINTNFTNIDTAVEVNSSTNITIQNIVTQTNWSIKTAAGTNISLINNSRLTNYSFANTPKLTLTSQGVASITFFNITNANGTNLSMDINLTTNRAHVNTSRSSGLNVSANITLLSFTPTLLSAVQVAYDDFTFEPCNPTKCQILSRAENNFIFNVSSFTTYRIVDSCSLINESSTLNNNILSPGGTCFDFNQSNILFDCAGYNITSNPAGVIGLNISPVTATSIKLSNITIQNCNIMNFSIGINVSSGTNITLLNNNITNVTNGIWLNNTAGSVLENNLVNATLGGLYSINSSNNTFNNNNIYCINSNCFWIVNGKNNVINKNTIKAPIFAALQLDTSANSNNLTNNLATGVLGIRIQTTLNELTNNTGIGTSSPGIRLDASSNILINSTGMSSSSKGIYLTSDSDNNILTGNTGTSSSDNGLMLEGSSNNILTANKGVSGTLVGIYLYSNSNNNSLINNTAKSASYSASYLSTTSVNNRFTNNTFETNKSVAVRIDSGNNNNNFTNNTLIGDTGFEINGSTNILITNTSFQNTNWSIKTALGTNISLIDNERMTNYTFANSPSTTITKTGIASINFFNIINANGTNLSMDVNLTSNKTHVNSTRSPGLNVNSNITMYNILLTNPVVLADFNDTTIFTTCPATTCTNLSYTANTFIFNTSHFTTFSVNENISQEPHIELINPQNATSFVYPQRPFNFSWNVTSSNTTLNCDLLINNTINKTIIGVTSGANSSTTVNLSRGIEYSWNVNCTDGTFTNISIGRIFNVNNSLPNFIQNMTNVSIKLGQNFYRQVNSTDPDLDQITYTNNQTDLFNISNTGVINTTPIDFTKIGSYNTIITINDNFGGITTSNFTYQINNSNIPNLSITSPTNNQIIKVGTNVSFTFNCNDDVNTTLNSLLYINGTLNQSFVGFANGTQQTLSRLFSEGAYQLQVNCTDGYNTNTSDLINFNVEDLVPQISLINPQNATTLIYNDRPFNFSWNTTDDINTTLNCDLLINNTINKTIIGITSGANSSTMVNLSPGKDYTWGINCTDGSKTNQTIFKIFNVTDTTPPVVTLNNPLDNYQNHTSDPTNVTFNCSATDNHLLQNISLYVTNRENTSFNLNQTTNISGEQNSTIWTLELRNGTYTWNCKAYDLSNNNAFATNNKSILINFSYPVFDVNITTNATNATTLTGNSNNISYTITIFNNGTTGDNITSTSTYNLTVQNPDNITIATLNQTTITLQVGTRANVTLQVGNILPGSFNTTVTAILSQNPAINATTPTITTTILQLGDAVISSTKTGTPNPAESGENLNYTITLNSIGNKTAQNVTVTEYYPEQITFITSTPTPTTGNNIWLIGNITNQTTSTINITIKKETPVTINITNNVNISYINSTGAQIIINNTQTTTINAAPPQSPSGGTAGAAGKVKQKNTTEEIIEALTIMPTFVKTKIKQGETKKEIITLTNTGNVALIAKLDATLGGMITFAQKEITIEPGNAQTITLLLTAPESKTPDAYISSITIKAGTQIEQRIPVIIDVIEKSALFDIQVNLPQKPLIIRPDETATADIILYNMGDIKPIDVTLKYAIRDMNNNELISQEETFAVNDQKEVKKSLKIPAKIEPGYYVFYAKANYGKNQTATSSALMQIIEQTISVEQPKQIEKTDSTIPAQLPISIFALIILGGLFIASRKIANTQAIRKTAIYTTLAWVLALNSLSQNQYQTTTTIIIVAMFLLLDFITTPKKTKENNFDENKYFNESKENYSKLSELNSHLNSIDIVSKDMNKQLEQQLKKIEKTIKHTDIHLWGEKIVQNKENKTKIEKIISYNKKLLEYIKNAKEILK